MPSQNSRLKVVLIVGLLWMVLSLVIFLLLADEPTRTQWLGLTFLLISEGAAVGVLAFLEIQPPTAGSLFRMGSYAAVILFALFALPMAVVHAAGAATSSSILIVSELIALVVLLTLEILLFVSSRSSAASDRAAAARMGQSLSLLASLDDILKIETLSPELTAKLKKLVEEVRFFDRSAVTSSDKLLSDKAMRLSELIKGAGGDAPPEAGKLIEEMTALAKVRQREGQDSQRGGF
ncbi:MAG: hypothetical protein LBJ64_08555 [Deltaproteobacteria bacterium]|jgi:hypothetical protein|nr:hypothetical protein [Deltaproteobacteria bacterium]